MKKSLTMALIAVAIAVCAFGAEGYKILTKIHIGGEGRWDYVAIDSANRRLYVSHSTSVDVVDPDAGKVVGNIPGCTACMASPSPTIWARGSSRTANRAA